MSCERKPGLAIGLALALLIACSSGDLTREEATSILEDTWSRAGAEGLVEESHHEFTVIGTEKLTKDSVVAEFTHRIWSSKEGERCMAGRASFQRAEKGWRVSEWNDGLGPCTESERLPVTSGRHGLRDNLLQWIWR